MGGTKDLKRIGGDSGVEKEGPVGGCGTEQILMTKEFLSAKGERALGGRECWRGEKKAMEKKVFVVAGKEKQTKWGVVKIGGERGVFKKKTKKKVF